MDSRLEAAMVRRLRIGTTHEGHTEMATSHDSLGQAVTPHYLDTDGCAARYQFSPAHWRRLVDAGKAPRPVKLGRLVRWEIRSLEEWESLGCPDCRHVAAKGGQR